MSVTIERLIAVVAPLHRMKKSTSIRIMVASFIVSVVYNQPRFFEIETVATKAADQDDDSPVSETIKIAQFIRDRILIVSTLNITLNTISITFVIQTEFVQPTALRLNPYYIQVYLIWMKIVLVELIPYVVILVANIWMASE